MSVEPAYFDGLFAQSDDPWAFRSRWYEARKRALSLACLPEPRYTTGFEPGCANGELSAALASRCDKLWVCDASDEAVAVAKRRLVGLPHVTVEHRWLPEQWPAQSFDLIVLSELCYYLDPDDLALLAERVRKTLGTKGTVLACHWRAPIEGCTLNGDSVHERLHLLLALPHLCRYADADMLVDVWCSDGQSLAQREALRP